MSSDELGEVNKGLKLALSRAEYRRYCLPPTAAWAEELRLWDGGYQAGLLEALRIVNARATALVDTELSNTDVAKQLDIRPATWRKMVSMGSAPVPDGYHQSGTVKFPYWHQSTISTYQTGRACKRGE